MLTVTRTASEMISRLTAEADLPPDGGLRIAQRDDPSCLRMALVAAPDRWDSIVIAGQARVFLDEQAAARLAGGRLDGRSGSTGASFFLDEDLPA